MKKLTLLFFILFNCCFSQIRLINNDTLDTNYYNYKEKIVKSFHYKKQFSTAQTGEGLFVMYDSICNSTKQKQRLIYANDLSRKYFYYKDSLIVRNWDMFDTPIEYQNCFLLSIYLKSKKYKNLIISMLYNRKDSLSRRLVISKPDSLTFYNNETYFDTNYDGTKLTKSQKYKLNNSSIYLDFNKKGFIYKLHYYTDNNKELFISFTDFAKPKEYGYYIYQENLNQGKFGIWYNYYENGYLLSEGEYCGSVFDNRGNEINSYKTGKWIYYTEQGCIEKEEMWDKGTLIIEKSNKKSKKVLKTHPSRTK